MKVGIIGAGFTGLTAAYRLSLAGASVSIFEHEEKPGGLALGFKDKKWNWSIEKHYHHWFTNDTYILKLAKEIGHKVLTVRPITSTYFAGQSWQIDSARSLLSFRELSVVDRIRCGIILFYLKITPYWKNLEKVSAYRFLKKYMGQKTWEVLWEPLFLKKFGRYYKKIPAVWFWARIRKRTPSLAYPNKGFQAFANHLSEKIRNQGAKFYYNTAVRQIYTKGGKIVLETEKGSFNFDKVICTLPTPLFLKITKGLGQKYQSRYKNLKGLGALNLMLILDKKFLQNDTYWLNINEKNFPFLAVVEHTNFMKKRNYNNKNVVYVGNYLESIHPFFLMHDKELLDLYFPFLKLIQPEFKKSWIKKVKLFKTNFAQPIIPYNYSLRMLPHNTPIDGLFVANIQQVYPWDRGTNYAVELGEKVANLAMEKS